jgi:hypothetical protein
MKEIEESLSLKDYFETFADPRVRFRTRHKLACVGKIATIF